MTGNDEKQPLVLNVSKEPANQSRHVRYIFSLGCILVLFKGSEEMAAVTMKQYVFHWCKIYFNYTDSQSAKPNSSTCDKTGSYNNTENEAQKLASQWELYYNLLNSVLILFSVSVFGTISDYSGRKYFFCLAVAGYTMRCAIITIVVYFDFHISFILIGYGLDGLCGSTYAVSLFSYSSLADVTADTKKRVFGIAVIEAIGGVGKLSTQFGNGYFIQHKGYFYPLLTATAGLSISFIIAVLFFMETKKSNKNTVYVSKNSTADVKTRTPCCLETSSCSVLIRNFFGFYVGGGKKKRGLFWLCLLVFILLEFALQGRSDTLPLYQLGSPFCWSSEMIGWYNALLVLVCYILGSMLLKPLQICFSTNVIACIGIVSAVAYNVVTGLATTTLWLYAAVGFGLLMILPKAILRGLASSEAQQHLQGAMFAGLQSSELVCKLASSPAALTIYSSTLSTMKGFVFLVLAGINAVSLIFMICLANVMNRKNRQGKEIAVNETDAGVSHKS